ncbi:MAG: peptide-N(4)-(N-acetyl-beta-glucosaminyl)asparagine amidase [Hamadaea sp.]|nr:peptide-N(4)-(N-acetyl-beta-glucosaminyl)asparagine amidase [Hamadaea sp.]
MLRLRRLLTAGLVVGLVVAPVPAAADTPPAEFGTDWHDPLTADPPIQTPPTRSCRVRIVDAHFQDFTPYRGDYAPPTECAGPWAKVVLSLDGQVAGRQFDRLGYLNVGGVTVFKTSTPEPSAEGIAWHVEKDVTAYSSLFARPQPIESLIGNVVNDTYTGVLHVQAYLTFYTADAGHPAPRGGADDVFGLTGVHAEGTARVGGLTVAPNTERLVAEVYATGSGGGCEEFWYLTAPAESGYSCPADEGPYREVQISVDGVLAGIAAPYPHIYTGGWSNPFLWYVLPAPRAFDIQPVRYDLSPFAGLLTDGREHTVSVTVAGVPAGQSGWDLPVTLLGWRDHGSSRVTGSLTRSVASPLVNDSSYADGSDQDSVTTNGAHRLTVSGFVNTSHGRVTTTVVRDLANTSSHRWGAEENPDALTAEWTDREIVTVTGPRVHDVRLADRRYAIDGAISVDEANRLVTTISLTDAASFVTDGVPVRQENAYTGTAGWTLGVPREDRHATATTSLHYTLTEPGRRYDRTLTAVNGTLTLNR